MADFTIELAGQNSQVLADNLNAVLATAGATVSTHSETEKDIDPLTIISVSLAAIQAAGVIWSWWQNHKSQRTTVIIRTSGGKNILLQTSDVASLEIRLSEDE